MALIDLEGNVIKFIDVPWVWGFPSISPDKKKMLVVKDGEINVFELKY